MALIRSAIRAATAATLLVAAVARAPADELANVGKPAGPSVGTQPASRPATQPTTQSATQPSTQSVDPQVLAALQGLSREDWQARRSAREQLVRMGLDVKPRVTEFLKQATDPEARAGAEAVLQQLEENRVLGPSFITLHVKDAEPKAVLQELSRQCGAPLLTWPDNLWDAGPAGNPLTLDVDRQPFWGVMRQISEKLGLDLRPFNNQGMRLMRGGGGQMNGPACIEGPFLIVANVITRTQTIVLGGARPAQEHFMLQMVAYPEPKIRVVRSSSVVTLQEATDDHGNSLVGENSTGPLWYGYGGGVWNLQAILKYPEKNPGSKITRLRGSTVFIVQTQVEKIEIPGIMHVRELSRQVGNHLSVTFREMKKNGDGYELKIALPGAAIGGPDWQELQEGLQTRLQVLDSEGQALEHRGMGTTGNNNEIELSLQLFPSTRPADGRRSGEPARLLWEVPKETKELRVPFEFKDLPMPAK